MAFESDESARRSANVRAAVMAGAIALFGMLFLIVVVLPGINDVLAALSEPVAIGVLLLLTTSVPLMAGVMGCRRVRAAVGTERRSEAMRSVLVGVAIACLLFEGVAMVSSWAVSIPFPYARLPLELGRWLVEAALGVFIVQPGPPQTLDPRLQRFVVRSGRSS